MHFWRAVVLAVRAQRRETPRRPAPRACSGVRCAIRCGVSSASESCYTHYLSTPAGSFTPASASACRSSAFSA